MLTIPEQLGILEDEICSPLYQRNSFQLSALRSFGGADVGQPVP